MKEFQTDRIMTKRFKQTLIGLFVAGVLFHLALILTIPLYPAKGLLPGYNDEPLHLHYVQHVAKGGGWGVYDAAESGPDMLNSEFMQSPLYYAMAAPAWRLGESLRSGWGLFAARIISALFGLIAALFAFRTALVWSNDRKLAVGVAAAMLFAPNAALFTSLVTNDSLLMLMAALALHSLVLSRIENSTTIRLVLTGVFIAGSAWAKLSGLALFPLIWFAYKPSFSAGRRWLSRMKVFIVAFALVMPLFTWNVIHYGHIYPGGGKSLIEKYAPESAVGVKGGAIRHPIDAIKIFLRTAAQPFLDIWGSPLEKVSSLLWVIFWSALMLIGAWTVSRSSPRGMMFIVVILFVAAGFVWRSIHIYQVEFRLFAPVFPAMAILTSRASATLRISPAVQAILWAAPLLILLIY